MAWLVSLPSSTGKIFNIRMPISGIIFRKRPRIFNISFRGVCDKIGCLQVLQSFSQAQRVALEQWMLHQVSTGGAVSRRPRKDRKLRWRSVSKKTCHRYARPRPQPLKIKGVRSSTPNDVMCKLEKRIPQVVSTSSAGQKSYYAVVRAPRFFLLKRSRVEGELFWGTFLASWDQT